MSKLSINVFKKHSSNKTLAVPRTRTTLGDRSFAVAGPRVWNSLPVAIRLITGYGQLTVYATSADTFIQGLEIATHCDS